MSTRSSRSVLRIHVLKHVPFEGPGWLADWARRRGYPLGISELYTSPTLPELNSFEVLAVMGGPMSVHDVDRHPWLAREERFIQEALSHGKGVVGICLGAQLLARALGAPVYANACNEIGWFPIQRAPEAHRSSFGELIPEVVEVFHWHGETFDIPSGAVRLWQSEACVNQAFALGDRAIALQFHLEATPQSIADLVFHCADDLAPDKFVQNAGRILAATDAYRNANVLLDKLLDFLSERVTVQS